MDRTMSCVTSITDKGLHAFLSSTIDCSVFQDECGSLGVFKFDLLSRQAMYLNSAALSRKCGC